MNKKGYTLIETLGAIVIMGITITIMAFVITTFINANERISISSLANEEGYFAVRMIQEDLNDFNPTTFGTCPGTACFEIEKEFVYVYNEVSEEIELVLYDPVLTYKLQILNNKLYINDIEHVFDGFTLHDTSSLEVVTELNSNFIRLNIVLESEKNDLFEYLMNYSFEGAVIPGA